MPTFLNVGNGPPQERADAARNRVRILAAASRLFSRHGIDRVSLDAIAAEAGVGKGTLFRRFGSKAGLAAALLDERERELQEAMISGPPPLGPDTDAAARLEAFFDAYLVFLEENLDLVYVSETASPRARYQVGSYHFWYTHVRILLTQIHPRTDVAYTAHALLASVAADLVGALIEDGFTFPRIRNGVRTLVNQLCAREQEPPEQSAH